MDTIITSSSVSIVQIETEMNKMALMYSQNLNKDQFNPFNLYISFKSCLKKTSELKMDFDDIAIREYLKAWEEINKFLEMLGSIFHFVISDVKEKIQLLENCLEKEPNVYETLQKAVDYERGKRMLEAPLSNKANGAVRTFLRLHRALIFVIKFLNNLFNADPKLSSSQISVDIYKTTLALHHSWVVKTAATLGMKGLPKREVLISYMIKSKEHHVYHPYVIQELEKVYNISQKIYEDNKLLDLP